MKIDIKFAERMIEIVAESFFIHGYLDEKDIESKNTLIDKMQEILDSETIDIDFVIDHSEYILDKAYSFEKSGDLDLSIVFFVIFFEHSLNKLIDYQLREKNISKKAKNELIRSVNIAGKCGWLLEVLDLPYFNRSHAKNIQELADNRNAFIHYKWNPKCEKNNDNRGELILKAKSTVKYLKNYLSRILYKGQKSKLDKLFAKKSNKKIKNSQSLHLS
ncbi:hypothetical protein [Francisella sciaenopsi]|uniref:RiboL-PSP-HEPN domain-containing protein n=1 Tax=Francisella sciaenopsi TaxID=3055034 RepID=A0ABQ6PH49_9GAMM